MRPCYPFEVVHVGGLHWGSYKRQVVHFCRLLVPLVRLNEQLEIYKRKHNTKPCDKSLLFRISPLGGGGRRSPKKNVKYNRIEMV